MTTWLPLTTYVSIIINMSSIPQPRLPHALPTPWPHGPPRGLGVCSKTSPLGRPFSHLRSLSVEPWVLWRLSHLAALRDTNGTPTGPWWLVSSPKKMDGIPPSHLVMVMFYRDQMTINQWIFRDTLLTKPQHRNAMGKAQQVVRSSRSASREISNISSQFFPVTMKLLPRIFWMPAGETSWRKPRATHCILRKCTTSLEYL